MSKIEKRPPMSLHDPKNLGEAPSGPEIKETDRQLAAIYLEILDRVVANECWQKIASELLQASPEAEPVSARARFNSYIERAKWMRDEGYKQLTSAETPVEMFRDWAASILLQMVQEGEIRDGVGNGPEMWAKETIQKLINDGKLQPDPFLEASQCAVRLNELLKTET